MVYLKEAFLLSGSLAFNVAQHTFLVVPVAQRQRLACCDFSSHIWKACFVIDADFFYIWAPVNPLLLLICLSHPNCQPVLSV